MDTLTTLKLILESTVIAVALLCGGLVTMMFYLAFQNSRVSRRISALKRNCHHKGS